MSDSKKKAPASKPAPKAPGKSMLELLSNKEQRSVSGAGNTRPKSGPSIVNH